MDDRTDLVEFLLARIAEDEAAATDEAIARASAGTVELGPAYDDHPAREALRAQLQEAVVDGRRTRPWSSAWDPARVLAECEVKRRIVEQYVDAVNHGKWATCSALERVLPLLALPYADNPDFREEWRPAS